jgi:hypothetical protein
LKKGAWSAAVNAETNRGKAAGLYIDRKIIKTGKLEDLSEQELETKMKQILEDYSQIIDVTPRPKEDRGAIRKKISLYRRLRYPRHYLPFLVHLEHPRLL